MSRIDQNTEGNLIELQSEGNRVYIITTELQPKSPENIAQKVDSEVLRAFLFRN